MKFKITYEKDGTQAKVVIEAKSLHEVMKLGFAQTHWDMVLEVTDEHDQRVANV